MTMSAESVASSLMAHVPIAGFLAMTVHSVCHHPLSPVRSNLLMVCHIVVGKCGHSFHLVSSLKGGASNDCGNNMKPSVALR